VIDLSNKNILFIAPKFYNYHQNIIDYMKLQKANVTFFAEDIYTVLFRISNKVLPPLANYLKQRYIDSILNNAQNNSYDIVFVIRGGILSPIVMEKLKISLPKAKYVMYQWDSNHQSQYESIIKYFDRVKTFDREDAQRCDLEYLPLFYSNKYAEIKKNKLDKQYDIVFYGAYHSDRLNIVKYIDTFSKEHHLNFKYHLYITKMALFRLFFLGKIKYKDIKYLKTYSVGIEEILEVYKQSFAILDIELNIQNGLTMRTFETLGSGLKLITTNTNILKEPFYNPNNIIIFDRDNYDLDLNLFKSDFSEDELLENYSFENWFLNLFKGVDK